MTHRPIKFRVWTGKRMLYQEKQYLASFIRRAVPKIIVDHDENAMYREHESYLPNGGNIDEYLMQFTGLLDKNGKEIYEGDIVKIGILTYLYEVKWNQFRTDDEDYFKGETWMVALETLYMNHEDCAIVGNIYENPELIEKQS